MDAAVQALAAHLDETWDRLLKDVAGADESRFHWTPGAEFNSVAILLRHLAGSERYWIGEAIGGIPSHRARDKEFVHDQPRREDVLRAVDEARRVDDGHRENDHIRSVHRERTRSPEAPRPTRA